MYGGECTIKILRMLYQHSWGTRRMVPRVQDEYENSMHSTGYHSAQTFHATIGDDG